MSAKTCPFNALRPELERVPQRMQHLPIDDRGYPVPWFVAWIELDGKRVPEFRAMDGQKLRRAVREKLCWVCGGKLGSYMTFVIGPMCAISRTSSEPPSHRECGEWSARNCPFLSRPQMVRRESGPGADQEKLKEAWADVAGIGLARNPGVTLLWTTRKYTLFDDGKGGVLFNIGEPDHVAWWAHGRAASREEVEESVRTGLPSLLALAEQEEGGVADVAKRKAAVEALYPL